MAKARAEASKAGMARAVLERYPRSHAEMLRIDVSKNTPAPLYQWLVASLLFSARIAADQAQSAARALFDAGWRTPRKMAGSTWAQRVKVLNGSGYARYDESTARFLGETTAKVLDLYKGDLRNLREAAAHDPDGERARLKAFKGIGDVGADIFFREVQVVWDELYPFADRKALAVGKKIGLGDDAKSLGRLVTRRDLPRLLSGLVRLGLSGKTDDFRRHEAD